MTRCRSRPVTLRAVECCRTAQRCAGAPPTQQATSEPTCFQLSAGPSCNHLHRRCTWGGPSLVTDTPRLTFSHVTSSARRWKGGANLSPPATADCGLLHRQLLHEQQRHACVWRRQRQCVGRVLGRHSVSCTSTLTTHRGRLTPPTHARQGAGAECHLSVCRSAAGAGIGLPKQHVRRLVPEGCLLPHPSRHRTVRCCGAVLPGQFIGPTGLSRGLLLSQRFRRASLSLRPLVPRQCECRPDRMPGW